MIHKTSISILEIKCQVEFHLRLFDSHVLKFNVLESMAELKFLKI
jgi:hypothetical protein